jgi:excisionase family DNA binding protein
MYPKFDGISVYQCKRCAVTFGVEKELDNASCPNCKDRSEIIGEGMMMFFLHVKPSIEKADVEVSENIDKIDYPAILNAAHVAEILGVSKRIVYEFMELKDFPLIRIGRLKRVNKDEFFTWLNQSKHS